MKDDWILFVDDEQEILDAIRRDIRLWLREKEITAMFVRSAGEALVEIARNPKPCSVMVTDLSMPHIEGPELLKAVTLRWPATVKIALTGAMSPDFVQDFIYTGVFSYIAKPWTKERLTFELERALVQHELKQKEELEHEAFEAWGLARRNPAEPGLSLEDELLGPDGEADDLELGPS
ncbi:MAG: response regulator [Rectinemataceae bacterium]